MYLQTFYKTLSYSFSDESSWKAVFLNIHFGWRIMQVTFSLVLVSWLVHITRSSSTVPKREIKLQRCLRKYISAICAHQFFIFHVCLKLWKDDYLILQKKLQLTRFKRSVYKHKYSPRFTNVYLHAHTHARIDTIL